MDLFIYRPVLSEPPILTMRDIYEWVTLDDLLDAHELLDLKAAQSERSLEDRGN